MKLLRSFILLILIGDLFYSCSNKSNTNIQHISSETLFSDSVLHTPYFLTATNELLFVANMKGDTIIDVYDINKKKAINHFLPRGEGAQEALHVMGIQYLTTDSSIYFSDPFRKTMYQVKNYKNNRPTITTTFKYDSEIGEGKDIGDWCKYMYNRKIIAASVNPDGMLMYFNSNFTNLHYIEKYPNKELVNESLNDWANIMLYQSCSAASPDGKHLAVAYYGADILGVASVVDKDSIVVHYQKNAYPNDIHVTQYNENTTQGAFTGKSISHYIGITASNKYFYTLYKGKMKKDCEEGLYRSSHVKCFDWNLNLIAEFKLDKDAFQIAISPDDKYIYALNSSAENGFSIVKYDLKE